MVPNSFTGKTRRFVAFVFLSALLFNDNTSLKAQIVKSSLLWQIKGPGIESPSYIFGTIHAIPGNLFFFPEKIKQTFEKCDKVVMEIKMDDPSFMSDFQQLMLTKTPLDSLLPEDDLKKLTAFFSDSLGLPFNSLAYIKPLLLSSFVVQKYVGKNSASYDLNFMQMASSAGKEIIGLETVQQQIGYIDKVPITDQCRMLVTSVRDYQKQKKEYYELLDTYLSEDIGKVYSKIAESSDEYQEFGSFLVDQRNQNWIPRILELTRKNSCFIAVGCGHLGGKKGVISLLENAGYSLTPIEL